MLKMTKATPPASCSPNSRPTFSRNSSSCPANRLLQFTRPVALHLSFLSLPCCPSPSCPAFSSNASQLPPWLATFLDLFFANTSLIAGILFPVAPRIRQPLLKHLLFLQQMLPSDSTSGGHVRPCSCGRRWAVAGISAMRKDTKNIYNCKMHASLLLSVQNYEQLHSSRVSHIRSVQNVRKWCMNANETFMGSLLACKWHLGRKFW